MKMPSRKEQRIAERYVLKRRLERPDTDAKKVIKYVIIFLISSFIIGIISLCLFQRLGILLLFPNRIIEFRVQHHKAFNLLFFICVYAICGLCCSRAAAIGVIKLYQHYAAEKIRRKCLFKPTCSEYAIMAIKKYGLVIGLIKIYIRLFFKCRGNVYRIDYP